MKLTSEERVTRLDPVFGPMGIAAGRHIWSIPQLTMREKTFLCLVADVCHPHLALPFELHVEMGMKQGITKEDFRECLRHLGPTPAIPPAPSPSSGCWRLRRISGCRTHLLQVTAMSRWVPRSIIRQRCSRNCGSSTVHSLSTSSSRPARSGAGQD